ncbi:hypothetical protein SprV_0802478700 [Sparganum proliferum]
MNVVDYNEKAQALLDDQQSYRSTPASQAKSMIGQLPGLLSRLRRNNVISLDEWRQTKPTDMALARFYGLPKIHKPNVPLRPIVALKGSPTYNLAKWMSRKLSFLRECSVTSVNSASQFLADIRGINIRPDQIMVSFDVVSLFTSIPPDLARDVLRKRLEKKDDEPTGPLKIQHLMQLFAFCQRTFFTFDGRTYEKIKGTPMGSPISSLVAELVVQELEKVAFCHYKPAFWRRYVDDTFVIIVKDKLSGFQDLLSSIFPDIQFTREEEEDEKLPFLDVLVTCTPDGELRPTMYRKSTNTTQLLNYHSNHPLVHKRGCVRALFDRARQDEVSRSRILEHKRAVRRGDPLFQVATHTLEEGNEFDFANTRILARAGNKTGRELLEAWVSDANSINRHIDLPACYHALRPRSPGGAAHTVAKCKRRHHAGGPSWTRRHKPYLATDVLPPPHGTAI